MANEPDFFLTTAGELRELLVEPRACWNVGRLRDAVRDDYMVVMIEPELIGQGFGLGSEDIRQLIISSRLQGFTLFPTSQFPCPVYVARILDEAVLRSGSFTRDQVELIAWGTIVKTREEAVKLAVATGWSMIRKDETELVGHWVRIEDHVVADSVAQRIETITKLWLVRVGAGDGWSTLWRDPNDGRFWERTYPEGHMHGGGPPALKVISESEARDKYGPWSRESRDKP
jgi:hypothetical protein